jgi:uncharacterized protein
MRTFLFLLLLMIGQSTWLLAQKPAPSATPSRTHASPPAVSDGAPSPAQVLKLMELLRVRDELRITLDAMKQQMKDAATETFRERIPDPTPEQLQSVNSVVDDVFAEISLDDLIKDLVPVYQRHLTRSDVSALIAFYSSPAGQKILREQAAMMKESMQVAGANQQKKMEELLAKLDVRMHQLIEQEQNKPDPEKK